jgi:hypothetical protein
VVVDLVVAGGVMLRESDVPMMMLRVESALSKAKRKRTQGPVVVHIEGDSEYGIAQLRKPATLVIEFQSGSSRPVVGAMVRFAKRAMRRSMRWYIGPIAEQQSRLNHSLLDLIERLRVQNETLTMELELLREQEHGDGD